MSNTTSRCNAATVFLSILLLTLGGTVGQTKVESTSSVDPNEIHRQLEIIKAEIERTNASPAVLRKYERLLFLQNDCIAETELASTKPDFLQQLSPTASLCINGSLAAGDPTFNRPLASSTGTGLGNGTVGNCSLSGTATAARYDEYQFFVSGCATFPTEVTFTLCGPAGCQHVGNIDSVLTIYRNVAAGDPLTANGGLNAVFNPASPCTNARAQQDDLGTTVGTTNNPGGSTCNQVVTTQCIGPCTSPSNAGALSGLRRELGQGRVTAIVTGFSNTTVGSYNLYVNAPGAGCTVSLSPTAAGASIGGRVMTAGGTGIRNAVVTLTGADLPEPIVALTGSFGYYNFENLPVGTSYLLTVSSKRFTFANPTQVVNLQDNVSDADFVSED